MTDFHIRVIIDPVPAVAGTKKVEGQLKRTKGAADKLRAVLLRTFVAGGILAAITGTTRVLADYSQEMSNVRAITGATAEEFALLDERAQDLGRNTRFSATQAAEGMAFLARAGFTAAESLEAVEGTLKLAQAGGLELGRAADIASNVLTAFRLEVDQTGRVVDVLASSATGANTTVGQLGDALKLVAPIAAGVNVPLEETTAALSALSDAGLQATLAGTGLRRVISELESPAAKTLDILDALGIAADDVRISQVGLTAALQALRDAGVDTGLALELFGDRGGPAFEVLSNSIPKIEEFTDRLENARGTADRIADVMDDNLKGALLRTGSAIQGLILALGDTGGLVVLTEGANGLSVALNFLTDNVEGLAVGLTALGVGFTLTKVGFLTSTTASIGATVAYIAANGAADALALAHTGLGVAALNAAAALKKAAVAAAASPFTVLVVGATAAAVAVAALVKGIDEYNAALKTAEGGELSGLTDFGKVGAQIARLNDRIGEFKERLDSGNISQEQFDRLAGNIQERIARLTEEQDRLSGATEKAAEAAAVEAEEYQKLNGAFERSKAALEDELTLLQKTTAERELAAAVLKELNAIQEEGGPGLTGLQQEELEGLLRRNLALRDQADALDEIKGPQVEFERGLAALSQLLADDRINLDEYNEALAKLAENAEGLNLEGIELPEGVDLGDTLKDIEAFVQAQQAAAEAEALRTETIKSLEGPEKALLARKQVLISLLGDETVNQERLAEAIAQVEDRLRPLTEEERRREDLLKNIEAAEASRAERLADLAFLNESGAISQKQYNEELRRLGELGNVDTPLIDRIAQLNAQFESGELTQREYIDQLQELQRFQGPSEEFLNGLATLNQELEAGTITVEEYLAKLKELGDSANNPVVTFADGAEDAFKRLEDQAKTTGEITSDILVGAFGRASDALADFAITGKLDFKELTRSILADIAKILAKQLLLQALGIGAPGAGAGVDLLTGAAGGGGVTGSASGGPFEANQSMIVGEKGPELVNFGAPGNVTPADQTRQALAAMGGAGRGSTEVNVSAAPVNLSVVNVDSPESARDAMNTPEGGKVIMNQVRSNKAALKRELGIS